MKVINLASGSDGNLTYLETENVKVLIDIGLSSTETIRRLDLISVNPNDIDAIFISHEHLDHTKGLDVFSSRFNVPAYAHRSVWQGLNRRLFRMLAHNKRQFDGESFEIKDLKIIPFEIPHDVPCFGYSFENNGKKISILTDFGHTTDRILKSIEGSQIVYLESNYDKVLLSRNEHYPLVLKRRIAGPYGHLSNDDAGELISRLAMTGTRQVVLAHLSKDNNTPDIAFKSAVKGLLKYGLIEGVHIRIDVASTKPGVMFRLG